MVFAPGKSAHFNIAYAKRTTDRVVALRGEESAWELFHFDATIAVEREFLDAKSILTQSALIQFFDDTGKTARYVNGIVTELQFLKSGKRFNQYRIRVEPLHCYLRYRTAYRIFQQKTLKEIIQSVCKSGGVPSDQLDFNLKQEGAALDYVVQYGETDWDFIKRRCEQSGWYWYFEHSEKLHKLVFTDHREGHQSHKPKALHYQEANGPAAEGSFVYRFDTHQEVSPNRWRVQDFSPMKPAYRFDGQASLPDDFGLEQIQYPVPMTSASEGDRRAQTFLQAARVSVSRNIAHSNIRTVQAGQEIELTSASRSDIQRSYFVAAVSHVADEPQVLEEDAPAQASQYNNTIVCIDADLPYRNPIATSLPNIFGYQTARVVGPKGDEIYTDEHGRIKIRFHWDASEKTDEHNSCWVRVAQSWAGMQMGSFVLPRVGQEVVVQFENGDPDRPIVTGAVYNGLNRSFHDLPKQKAQTSIRTRTSDKKDFHELRIDDQSDKAGIYLQSAKDWTRHVKRDSKTFVGNDQSLVVKKDQIEIVEGEKHQTIKGDHAKKIEKTLSLDIANDLQMKTGGDAAIDAKEFYIYADKIVLDGANEITLKSGSNFIKLDSGGVTIKGSMIKLNEGGSAGSGKRAKVVEVKKAKELVQSAKRNSNKEQAKKTSFTAGALQIPAESGNSSASNDQASTTDDKQKAKETKPSIKNIAWVDKKIDISNAARLRITTTGCEAGESIEVEIFLKRGDQLESFDKVSGQIENGNGSTTLAWKPKAESNAEWENIEDDDEDGAFHFVAKAKINQLTSEYSNEIVVTQTITLVYTNADGHPLESDAKVSIENREKKQKTGTLNSGMAVIDNVSTGSVEIKK